MTPGGRPVFLPALLFALLALACADGTPAGSRHELDLSGGGWWLYLDRQAPWADDVLQLPGVDVATLPARPPTPGWERARAQAVPVTVPGTVEAHLDGEDYRGVSFWMRPLPVPADAGPGRRVTLRFGAVRLRAEVFLDGQLVGYDAVGNTPFQVDLTGRVHPGTVQQLAVRVTDPGGNLDWVDHTAQHWGRQTIPASHGFGGVSGSVRLVVTDPVWVDDVFVRTTPEVTAVDVQTTVRNDTGATLTTRPRLSLADAAAPDRELLARDLDEVELRPGETVLTTRLSLPDAVPWSPEHPALYLCRVALPGGDRQTVRFGFRWFAPDGLGRDAVLRLNGRRVVLRSAISWGFWPTTGLVPGRELAERQVQAARAFGLDMLNHHRGLAAEGLLDVQDELGLLAYEEPGGYWCQGGDAFCFALAREKWLRMVRRDRNHPSLVIYDMINEAKLPADERALADMAAAAAIDPTRLITYTSAWSDDPALGSDHHVRPGDPTIHAEGWWDQHDAPGPGVWRDAFWAGPDDHRRLVEHRDEVVFLGEEGAIAEPPRLALMAGQIDPDHPGWDGTAYLDRERSLRGWLEQRDMLDSVGGLDALTRSLGDVALTYHARMLENVRLDDVTDGYVINGWEGSKLDNHSGIVDCWRNPKGHAERLARAAAPLMLAVKLRRSVVQAGQAYGVVTAPTVVRADVGVANEVGLSGPWALRLELLDGAGATLWTATRPVTLEGGEHFGQMLATDVPLYVEQGAGRYTLRAELTPPDAPDAVRVAGQQDLLVVDWKGLELPPGGALVDGQGRVTRFLAVGKGLPLPAFDGDLPPLPYVVLADLPAEPRESVPASVLATPEGAPGLTAEVFDDGGLEHPVLQRIDPAPELGPAEAEPDAGLLPSGWSLRWRAVLTPPESGPYRFHLSASGPVRLALGGRTVLDRWSAAGGGLHTSERVDLRAGEPVELTVEFAAGDDRARLQLAWTTPSLGAPARELATELLRRVSEDGTRLVVLGPVDGWARLFAEQGALKLDGRLDMGRYWLGGGFFARPHPLLEGLPAGGALGWEYQALVHYQMPRYGLLLEDEEAVVGCLSDHQPEVGTALGIVRHGRGSVLLCTLGLTRVLADPPGPADVARLLLCNCVRWAGAPTPAPPPGDG